MFDVQKAGLGAAKGIPSIIVAAASFDDMVAITGYSLFSNLAIRSEEGGSLGWQLAKGPLDIAFGLVGGFLGAAFCSLTVIWNTRLRRSAVVLLTGARASSGDSECAVGRIGRSLCCPRHATSGA